jgi:uncharacterized protein
LAKIFISYSRTDRETVDFLVPRIRNVYGDDSYWYDTGIQGGNDWWKTIESEIQVCQVFLFLMSDNSVRSQYCIDELRKALQHRKSVLQVLLPTLHVEYEQCLPQDLHIQLKVDQYVDLRKQYDKERQVYNDLSRLWGALNNLISNNRLPLTTTERWLLHNQFEILKQISPDHPDYRDDYFQNAIEILSHGYEWYYDDIAQHIYTRIFPYSNASEIVDILSMFLSLQLAYQQLDDTSGIDSILIEFAGFSGNDETSEMQFTRFMMESMGQFEEVRPKHGMNSHCPMLDIYRDMLKAWNESADKHDLSKEDIIRIADSRNTR